MPSRSRETCKTSRRQGFHVFAIDALYHGLTDKEPYDDDERYLYQVDALVDLLDALGIDRAHVEGESMGATIAFHFGLSHPERARKIVLNTGFGHVKLDKRDFAPVKGDMKELASLSREVVVDPSVEAMRKRLEWVVHDPASMTDEMVAVRLALYEMPEVNASMRKVFRIDKDWSWDLPYGEKDLGPTSRTRWCSGPSSTRVTDRTTASTSRASCPTGGSTASTTPGTGPSGRSPRSTTPC